MTEYMHGLEWAQTGIHVIVHGERVYRSDPGKGKAIGFGRTRWISTQPTMINCPVRFTSFPSPSPYSFELYKFETVLRNSMSESQPILPSSANPVNTPRKRRVTAGFVLVSLIAACILVGILGDKKAPEERLPEGSLELAKYYLDRSPVIDSHIDLPELARVRFGNDVDSFDLNKETVSDKEDRGDDRLEK